MISPTVSDIMHTDVEVLPSDAVLDDAVRAILDTSRSYVVVASEAGYCLLEVYDLVCLYRLVDKHTPLHMLYLEPMVCLDATMRTSETVTFLKEGKETFAAVDHDGTFRGVVLQADLLSSIDPETLIEHYRIGDLFKIKKRSRWIPPTMSMKQVVDDMQMKQHDAYIIIDEGKPVGILTCKDLLYLIRDGIYYTSPVSVYMKRPVKTLPHTATLKEAIAFMEESGYDRIVSVDDAGYMVGSLTKKELLSSTFTRWVESVMRYHQELQAINKELEDKTRIYETIATRDTLTGLYNRRKFLELFVLEYTVMMERENRMAIMLIDIDRFKHINDTYGHNTGDEVIRAVTDVLKRAFREVDIIARWGGDEFVALLPAADRKTAYEIAEHRIRRRIEEDPKNRLGVTVSIGIAEVLPGDDVQRAVGRADEMLYEAKKRGRNCVAMA